MAAEVIQMRSSPQVEDGYTRIANELFEAVTSSDVCPITLRQIRIVMAVIRKTYGYQKKVDRISDGQLADATGMSRQNVNTAKRQLLAFGVLYMDGNRIGVNKHHDQWDFTAKPEIDNLRQTRDSVSKPKTKSVSKKGSHKRKKETLSTDVESETPKTRRRQLDISVFADEVSIETLEAFAEHRRALRSPLTQRAMELTVKAATKAANELGITAEQAIDEAIAAGWKTVRTEWLRNRGADKPASASGAPPCPHAEILAAWNDELGDAKGVAPSLVDWRGTRACALLEERWQENYNAESGSGAVRYTDAESGVGWWRMAFQTLKAKPNFMNSDVDLFNLFYKETFVRAAQGKLNGQKGPTR